MNLSVLLSPPVTFIIYFVVVTLGYIFIQRYSAKGLDHPEKHLPYSGGQKLPPVEVRLSYENFFRIGLLFGIVHVAVLVLATLPIMFEFHWVGLIYLIGISISAVVLAQKNHR